jgi:hypothetical protein
LGEARPLFIVPASHRADDKTQGRFSDMPLPANRTDPTTRPDDLGLVDQVLTWAELDLFGLIQEDRYE